MRARRRRFCPMPPRDCSIAHAGSDEQKERWLPGIASGAERGAAAFEPRSNDLVADADGASVLVLDDGEDAVLAEPGQAQVEPVALIDATRCIRAGRAERRRGPAARRRRGGDGPNPGRAGR